MNWIQPSERQRAAFLRHKIDLVEIRKIVLEKMRQGVIKRRLENRFVECIACCGFELRDYENESSRYDFVRK